MRKHVHMRRRKNGLQYLPSPMARNVSRRPIPDSSNTETAASFPGRWTQRHVHTQRKAWHSRASMSTRAQRAACEARRIEVRYVYRAVGRPRLSPVVCSAAASATPSLPSVMFTCISIAIYGTRRGERVHSVRAAPPTNE